MGDKVRVDRDGFPWTDGSLGPDARAGMLVLLSHPQNGLDSDQQKAGVKLTVGAAYRIAEVDVGAWRTDLRLEGVDGWFNSCLFSEFPD